MIIESNAIFSVCSSFQTLLAQPYVFLLLTEFLALCTYPLLLPINSQHRDTPSLSHAPKAVSCSKDRGEMDIGPVIISSSGYLNFDAMTVSILRLDEV